MTQEVGGRGNDHEKEGEEEKKEEGFTLRTERHRRKQEGENDRGLREIQDLKGERHPKNPSPPPACSPPCSLPPSQEYTSIQSGSSPGEEYFTEGNHRLAYKGKH